MHKKLWQKTAILMAIAITILPFPFFMYYDNDFNGKWQHRQSFL